MIRWILLLMLFQGVPIPAFQSGSITGVVTNSTGKPAVRVRVSALVRSDSPLDALTATSMASLAETDENGAYRLENIPPGRYYIAAGRVDRPTYYPGTLDMSAAKDVQITPGAAITGMNFTLKDNSAGRADPLSGINLATSWSIPIRVTVEGGGKVPLFSDGLFSVLRLTRVSDNQTIDTPLTSTSLVVPLAPNPEYRVTIEGLSKRYAVRSIVSDKTDLLANPLRLPLPPTSTSISNVATGQGLIFWVIGAGLAASLPPPLPPVPAIQVTLQETIGAPRTGATLSGVIANPLGRSIEVSGITGSIYEDGSFEVKNVPPGRHTLLTRTTPAGTRPFGASIIVGDRDIANIQLQLILEIPRDLDANVASSLSGTYSPGTVIPLPTVRGHLVDETTGVRFNVNRSIGRITINGNTVSYTINNTGEFETQNLLPGRYDLELWIFGGKSYSRTLDVRDENLTIQWPVSVPD